MKTLILPYGPTAPLALEVEASALVAECLGPEGATAEAAETIVTTALATPADGPPLAAHVVPGDRVVIAFCGRVPEAPAVSRTLSRHLLAGGVAPEDIHILQAPSLAPAIRDELGGPAAILPGGSLFDPAVDADTAYLAADEDGQPLYLARALVDADVVVSVGAWEFDASLGGRSLAGELWPTFARQACRDELTLSLARKGRHALATWRSNMQEAAWQLGVCASLRLVAGRNGSLASASFGLPESVARQSRRAADAWAPAVAAPASLAICSLTHPRGGFAAVIRAVAAAARVTRPDGTICIASEVTEVPGVIFSRWRQGAALQPLIHEAVQTGDRALVADALETRLFARAIEDRRLVLLSALEESTVEDLEFGFADAPAVVERLARRAESLVVLHEADRMFPSLQ